MFRFLAFVLLAFAAVPAAAQPAAAPAAFTSDRIGVTVTGAGPDVVLVPGLASEPGVWRSTMAALPGYRYHLIHVSGFAGRPAGANAEGPVLIPVAAEIARYIREARLDRPVIVGHSMGGSLAILVAGRNPGLVSKVMVVDMMPYLGAMFRQPGSTDAQLEEMAGRLRGMLAGADGEMRRIQTSTIVAGMVRTESERPAILAASMASDSAVSAQSMYDLIVSNLVPDVAAIRVPMTVLYVQPTGAPLTPEQIDNYYRLSYRAAPQAVVRRIPDSAHFIMFDQPAVFQTALREFLAAPAPAPAAAPAPAPAPAPPAPAPATPAPSPS
jgi:pimeloyl-ACP methyl ester carboxylesterase